MAPCGNHQPHLALASVTIADAFVARARAGPEAGLCSHPCQDVLGTIPGRLDRGEVKCGGPSRCRTWHLHPQHTMDGGDTRACGQSTKSPCGWCEDRALHPPAHSNCWQLGNGPQAGRPQTYAFNDDPLPPSLTLGPCWENSGVSGRGLCMTLTFTSGTAPDPE